MPIDRYSKETFEEALKKFRSGWQGVFEKGEWVYSLPVGEGGEIFVHSSIGADDFAKTTGKDSIRVYVKYNGRFMKDSQRWTTRMPGWAERMRARLHDAFILIRDIEYSPKCPNCGGPMVIRKGVHGKFYGCLKFPKCRGTRNYASDANLQGVGGVKIGL